MSEWYGNRVLTTTQTHYLPKMVDTVLNSNIEFTRLVNASKPWKSNGGRKMEIVVKTSTNNTFQTFDGADTFSNAATDNRVRMEYFPKWSQITSTFFGSELSVNDTEDKILDLISLTLESDSQDMADQLGSLFYSSDGTGNGSKDPLGLAAIVDDGSTVSTIGGLSRTTYPTLAGTVTSSSGTLTVAKMDTLWIAVSSGAQTPTTAPCTEAIHNFYGQLIRPQERINKDVGTTKALKGGTGFTGLNYRGIPLLPDEKCTSGVLFFLNEDYLDFYALPMHGAKAVSYKSQIDGNDYGSPLGLGFSSTGMIQAQNAASWSMHHYFGGQFVTNNPKRHGKLTAITGI